MDPEKDSQKTIKQITLGLLAVAGALVAGHLLAFIPLTRSSLTLPIVRSLECENCVSSVYSALLLLSSAVLLYRHARVSGSRGIREQLSWYFLSFVFVFVAFDEAFRIHEQVGEHLPAMFRLFPGEPKSAWFAYGITFSALSLIGALPALLSLSRLYLRYFFLCAAIFLSGSLGVELLTWIHRPANPYDDLGFGLLVAAEELCEIIGASLFVVVLASLNWHERESTEPPNSLSYTTVCGLLVIASILSVLLLGFLL